MHRSRRGKHLCAIAIQMSAATAFFKLRNRFPRRERGRVGAGWWLALTPHPPVGFLFCSPLWFMASTHPSPSCGFYFLFTPLVDGEHSPLTPLWGFFSVHPFGWWRALTPHPPVGFFFPFPPFARSFHSVYMKVCLTSMAASGSGVDPGTR